MKVSELITDLGKDFKKEFSIENEPLFSQYRKVFEILNNSDKGVLLIGNIGCGKSMLMKVMQRLFKDTENSFRWVSSKDLRDMLEEMKPLDIKIRYGSNLKMNLYIDDIGIQKNKNDYGNIVNIVSELIFEREELFQNEGYKTHFSSNLPHSSETAVETLEVLFGKRVIDRVYGMCELISWNSKSLRRK
jgi:DNA replication protein DnaC